MAGQPTGPANIDGGTSKTAVILCHGRGQHPIWKVVDPLHKAIYDKIGYHTLSLQLPSAKKKWPSMNQTCHEPEKKSRPVSPSCAMKKVERIYLMGHSMGSRMAISYLATHPDAPIAGFIGGGEPLDSNSNLRHVKIPAVDIFGDSGDSVDLQQSKARADMVSDRYKQVLIPDASHTFDGKEDEMVKAVIDWLSERN